MQRLVDMKTDDVGAKDQSSLDLNVRVADPIAGGNDLRVGRRFVIPSGELQWRFSGSGGPGGQHANTSNTRVELFYDIATSSALGPRQRARLIERFGPTARLVVSEERSQARNREIALRRLAERLDQALLSQRPRVPTAPTGASRERRLRDKRLRSLRKEERRPISEA